MRFLHASDLQIGRAFSHVYRKAEALRIARFDVVEVLFARAVHERVEFIVLAGNTLADNRIAAKELKRLATLLEQTPVPLYLLPGRTDPWTIDSPWRLQPELWKSVHILTEPQPVPVEGGALYPMPWRSRQERPPLWIPPRTPGDGIRVGVACNELAPDLPDVDYLAMGGRARHERELHVAWSGAPEGLDFGDERGRALVVTLGSGDGPVLNSKFVGRLHWQKRDLKVKSPEHLQGELETIKNPENVLLKLSLRGALSLPAVVETLAQVRAFQPHLYHLELNDELEVVLHHDFDEPLTRVLLQKVAASRAAILELHDLVASTGGR